MLIKNETSMRQLGAALISLCTSGGVIALSGDLGTGKTTLVRGALESLGVVSGVRSPTYTLIEYYDIKPLAIAHFDLYRLAEGEELEYLGYRDYLNETTICLIEWPEKARGYLNNVGLELLLEYHPMGRMVEFRALNDWGKRLESQLNLE